MGRPSVDVVVPFAGSAGELEQLRQRMARLTLAGGDSLVIVDNRPSPPDRGTGRPPPTADAGHGGGEVLTANAEASPPYARNRGAERGSAEWILFLDADVQPPPDLLQRYFRPAPASVTAVLAGGVRDEAPSPGDPPVVRYQFLRGLMSQEVNLEHGFAKTANCAVRRSAFEAVGGFTEGIPSGEDVDLCFRLRDAGWRIERREQAAVVHRSRRTLRALLGQMGRHGGGLAWVDRRHPGSFPARRRPGLALWALRRLARSTVALVRGDRDAATVDALDAVTVWAVELGRLGRNRARRRGEAATASAPGGHPVGQPRAQPRERR